MGIDRCPTKRGMWDEKPIGAAASGDLRFRRASCFHAAGRRWQRLLQGDPGLARSSARGWLCVFLTAVGYVSLATLGTGAEIFLRVTRPEPGEILSIAKGKTFVIGVVNPPTASVECNGVSCDVSVDGAFIGYAPFEALAAPVRQGTNWCDVAFDFVARAEGESVTNRVWTISPRSPSAALVPEEVFDPPKPVRILRDAWLGVRSGGIGRTFFAAEGAVFPAASAGTDGWRVRLGTGEEAVVPSEQAEPSTDGALWFRGWILEDREGFRVVARRLGNGGEMVSSGAPCPWGFGFEIDGERARIRPRPTPPALSHEEAAQRPLRGLRVCLDPGHHPDRGAVGPRGLEERESNLLIAREVARRLHEEGAEVSFTREEGPLPLRERHRRIRELDPDVLVSLHNNSVGDNQDPRLKHGTQTFWCHPWSKDLAEKMHASILRALGTTDMGCIRRDLYLPRYPGCPAVLLEPEYLILPDVEKQFLDEAWRGKLAGAIVDGLREFALARRSSGTSQRPERP